MKKLATVNKLAEITGADRRSVKKWLEWAGIAPVKTECLNQHQSPLVDKARAIAAIQEFQSRRERTEAQLDPETGLTWWQLKTQQEAMILRRENEIAEGLRQKTYMKVEDHEKVVLAIVGSLESLPHKARSQFGLCEAQAAGLERLIDECRRDARKRLDEL